MGGFLMELPDEVTEDVPTIFMNGNEVVEVAVTRWHGKQESWAARVWQMVEGITITPTSDGDRVIFELPTGCFESHVRFWKGSKLTLMMGDGTGLGVAVTKCERRAVGESVSRIVPQPAAQPSVWQALKRILVH